MAQVAFDEKNEALKERSSSKSNKGEREKVESRVVGTALNVGQADDSWEGVIGFCHPFWYVLEKCSYPFFWFC